MNPAVIAIVVIAFIISVIGIAYALAASTRENEQDNQNLPVKKVNDLINTFQNFQAPVIRRSQAMDDLILLATPEALEALTGALSHRDDPLWTDLVTKLPNIGAPVYPFLTKAFRSTISRPAILRMMQAVGPNSALWVTSYLNDPSMKTQHEAIQAMDKSGWVPGKDAVSAAYWIAKKEFANCVSIGAPAVFPLMESLKNADSIDGPIMALGLIGDLRAAPSLLKLCQDSRARTSVIKTFIKWGDPCLPAIVPELTNMDETIRTAALEILDGLNWNPSSNEAGARYWIAKKRWDKCADIGSPAVIPLAEIISQKDTEQRQSAIQTLGLIGDEASLNILLKILFEPDPPSQLAAVLALGCIKNLTAVQGLIKILGIDPLAPSAMKALTNLGELAKEPLVIELKSTDIKVRNRAAETLKSLKWNPLTPDDQAHFLIATQNWDALSQIGASAIDLLIIELDKPETCGNAAEALVKIGDERATNAILNAMNGKPNYAQLALADALGKLGSRAVDSILGALEKDNPPVLPLLQALGKTGDPKAIEPLTRYLSPRTPISIREVAAEALGNMGQQAVDPILSAMTHSAMEPRSTGLALGMAGRKSREKLIEAINHKRYDMQIIVGALGQIPDAESARAIISIMHGGDGARYGVAIRTTAQEALVEIGFKSIQPLIDALANYPADQAVFTPVLVKLGEIAIEPLISALKNSSQSWQRQSIIEILGNIGDRKAVNPLLEIQNSYPIHKNHVNEALAKIQKANA